jgi:uncharacterized membrane protein
VNERALRAAIATLALAGAAIAAYLTILHYTHNAPVCPTSGCETVQRSKYAELAGIPVALLGLLAYLSIAATAATRRPEAAAIGAALSLVALAFSAYLLIVSLAVIHAVCVWCVGTDVIVVLLTGAALLRLRPARP